MGTKAAIGGLLGVTLVLAAYALGRATRGDEEVRRPHRRAPQAGTVPEEISTGTNEAPVPATRDAPLRVDDPLASIQDDVRRLANGRTAQLNDLQNTLSAGLAEGKIAPGQVIEMFRRETDPATLDVLQGVLAANPEAADKAAVVDAFLQMAAADPEAARRQAAVAYLGGAWDKEGRVRDALFALARDEKDLSLRLTALATLESYSIKNREQAATVNAGLLTLARQDGSADVRAQALTALEIRSAQEDAVRQLAVFLDDPTPSVRLASADKLGNAPPECRAPVVAALERALGQEREAGVKSLLLASLVRAGRAEALEALRRAALRDPELLPHAEDYIAILKKGVSDWNDIAQEKASLEAGRAR